MQWKKVHLLDSAWDVMLKEQEWDQMTDSQSLALSLVAAKAHALVESSVFLLVSHLDSCLVALSDCSMVYACIHFHFISICQLSESLRVSQISKTKAKQSEVRKGLINKRKKKKKRVKTQLK